MKSAINSVRIEQPSSNLFNYSHEHKTSCNMGDLVPVTVQECIPGDRWRLSGEALVRFAPMLAPMMHHVDVYLHYWFVPNRLVWENWETWITNGSVSGFDQGGVLPAHPIVRYAKIAATGIAAYTRLMDYMGLPDPEHSPNVDNAAETISALPFGAYQLICEEWYRDENLQQNFDWQLQDGNNSDTNMLFQIRKRCWEPDYFTKALPWAQKGLPVDLPLGEITLDPDWGTGSPVPPPPVWVNGMNVISVGDLSTDTGGVHTTGSGVTPVAYDPKGSLVVDATTINDFRLAMKLQEWLELNAVGGTRYSEQVLAHFGVRPQDARLQRPEFIGGFKQPVQISEVLNTAGDTLPQGNMSGHGAAYVQGNYANYFCSEHGYIIGIMSIMPKTSYFQGIPRHWLKFNHPTELAWPKFAHLGEQEVYNKEIFAFQGADGANTFGYQPRFQEYKTPVNYVSGDFKINAPGGVITENLGYWHMARYFVNAPQLNDTFVESNPTHRVFNVTDPTVQKLYCHIRHDVMVRRLLPVFATPSL